LRHAALKGIRPDKKPRLIRRSAHDESGSFADLGDIPRAAYERVHSL